MTRLSARVGTLSAITLLLTALSAPAATAATTQYGCTFSVPKPTITRGKASFKVVVSCPASSRPYNRQVVVDLMGDDVANDDVMGWTVQDTASARTHTVTRSGWGCNEDVGTDELYLRVHIEKGGPGNVGWVKGPWIKGATVSGTCT